MSQSHRQKRKDLQHRKCARTLLKYSFSTGQSPAKDLSEASTPHPALLTLLLLFPAVISKVCNIVILHAPFNVFQVRARVFICKVLGYVVDDFQVLCHPPVCVAHRPGSGRRVRTVQDRAKSPQLFKTHNMPRYQTTGNIHHSCASPGLKIWKGEAFLVEK